MRILVTGGAGFIGSHLVDALVAAGHRVRVLDSLEPQVHGPGGQRPAYLNPKAELLVGDVRDRAQVARALDGVDAVFHEAAAVGVGQSMYEIERYVSANAVGAAVVLEGILERRDRIRKVVVASSMSLYGEGAYRAPDGSTVAPPLRTEADLAAHRFELHTAEGAPLVPVPTPENKPLQPTSIYAITKRDHEEMFLTVGQAYGIPVVALRYFNVYGTRQALSNPYTGVLAIFATRIANGQPPMIFEDGQQRRDFVHVRDVARAFLLALDHPDADGEVFNIGSGEDRTVEAVARLQAAAMGRSDLEPEITERSRAGDIRHNIPDLAKARGMLGYDPDEDFAAGLAELAEWVARQEAQDRVAEARRELEIRGLVA